MLRRRPADSIHREEGGWYSAKWHFSFDRYYDPGYMGVGPLRVFNDDTLIPGAAWPLHPHRDVEGLTYVVEGRFRHEDDLGNDGEIPAGSAQRMTLGRGAWHSEQNASTDQPMRFVQMWILPHTASLPPTCEQRVFSIEDRRGRLLVIFAADSVIEDFEARARRDGVPPPIPVHGHAIVAVASLGPYNKVRWEFRAGGLKNSSLAGYVFVISGRARVAGRESTVLEPGDAAIVDGEPALEFLAEEPSELLVVDVPREYTPVGIWASR